MKKRRPLLVLAKKSILYSCIILMVFVLIFCSDYTLPAARDALLVCAESVIPALFPFFVLSKMLVRSGFVTASGKLFSPFMRILFNTGKSSGAAFLIGLISGYPAGAKSVCDLYKYGYTSKEEAERLLGFCNNSGPLFIIGTVGCSMAGSRNLGIFLYIIHLISAVMTGVFLRFSGKSNTLKNRTARPAAKVLSFGESLSHSLKDSVDSTLMVCGFILFFSCISSPFLHIFQDGSVLSCVIKGFLEVTLGAECAASLSSYKLKMCVLSALLGFGGICVYFQVLAVAAKEGLGTKKYLMGKLFQSGFSAFLCMLLIKNTDAAPAFAATDAVNFETGNTGALITSVFIICFFYFVVLSLRKNSKKY